MGAALRLIQRRTGARNVHGAARLESGTDSLLDSRTISKGLPASGTRARDLAYAYRDRRRTRHQPSAATRGLRSEGCSVTSIFTTGSQRKGKPRKVLSVPVVNRS